jgi:hypothetical protein
LNCHPLFHHLLLFFCCCTCILSLTTLHAPSDFMVVIFTARLKWTLNALSLGSIIVCLVISLKIGKFGRTRCQCCTYIVIQSNSVLRHSNHCRCP